jgi:hypothetical protein
LSKSGKSNTVKDLIGEYWGSDLKELDDKLGKIKIIDPACGSGAFLNKAGDILLEIHKAIHEKKYMDKMDTLAPYFDNIEMRREILLNNIYGVDLNEESVEITKLSLFLKVCKKGLKLPNLDNNIKCGNSLIDDPEFAGDKAFNWKEEFKDIFSEGGFDVLVGNPPYVRYQSIKDIKPYLKLNYEIYTGQSDLFVYFFEKGINILKSGGLFSFISSNKFIKANYGKPLRNLILRNTFLKYVDLTGGNIFSDATVDPCIIIFKKYKPTENNKLVVNNEFKILQNKFNNNSWSFNHPKILDLRDKIQTTGIKIKNISNLNIYYGIKTGYDKAFIIDKKTKDDITIDKKNLEFIKPLLGGKDVSKWKINYTNKYLLYIPWGFPIDNHVLIKKYLLKFEEKLRNRSGVKDGNFEWFALHRYASGYYKEFNKEKIIWSEISSKPSFTKDTNELFLLASMFFMVSENHEYELDYILVLLNSKLLFWLFSHIASSLGGKGLRYFKQFVEQLPIYPAPLEEQKPFIEKADKMLKINKSLQNEINSFKEWLNHIFKVEKFSKKLEKYYELSVDEFLAELRKKKVDVKNRDNFTTLKEEFEKSVSKIRPLLQEIEETDNEIDQMVYELYGLTADEIKIIEDSINS